MDRSQRLQPVAKLARSREDDAARELSAWQKKTADCEQQLTHLRNFRMEYSQRLQAAGQVGMNAREFQDFNRFISRLDTAIERQQSRLGQLRAECEIKRQHWLASHARTKGLDKVIESHNAAEMQARARREQLALDERAQRAVQHPRGFKK